MLFGLIKPLSSYFTDRQSRAVASIMQKVEKSKTKMVDWDELTHEEQNQIDLAVIDLRLYPVEKSDGIYYRKASGLDKLRLIFG